MASLPYIPTQILTSSAADGLIYIFQPGSDAHSGQLLALNTTITLNNANLPLVTVSPTLPFLKDEETGYTPVIDNEGNIFAYAGDCTSGASASSLWQLKNPKSDLKGNPSWQEVSMAATGLVGPQNLAGANNLAAGFTFAPTTNSSADIYIFGGMCPNSTSSTAKDWTQAANYSNSMLTIQSDQPSSTSPTSFSLGMSLSKGPPVAEAGFTVTPLDPTFSTPEKNQTASQNQNFVLVGGHTQTAFINMSQVALFSLPERSWSFLPVDLPSDTPTTDLAVRDSTIDSRSGHTAVLSSDGSKIIVLGGWVGDITQPADPQLAILELGQGYGGSGDWQWSVPDPTGPGLASGTGIYGHGATLLSGDVMMVVGGYQISSSGNSKTKRQSSPVSSQTYFFNTTSNAWITNYSPPPPNSNTSNGSTQDKDGEESATKKTGLAVGLTLGILALITLVIIYFWYSKRLKQRREARDEELRGLAASAQRYDPSDITVDDPHDSANEMRSVDRPGGALLWNSGRPNAAGSRAEFDADRTGLSYDVPSPTRGLRRSLHSRGTYQPAPRFDNGRRTPDFNIHPIDERDEYDEEIDNETGPVDYETIQRRDFDLLSNVPVLNPPDRSRSSSPQSPQERETEIRRWVNDWTAADALMHHQADRLSPDKTDRTSSSLSEQSARSMLSSGSAQHSVGTVSRTLSQRSAALFSVAPFRSTNDATPFDIQGSASGHNPRAGHQRSQSLTSYSGNDRMIERATDTPNSFATARTSIPHHSETEGLLSDYPEQMSPTRTRSRARGWMGSVRRVFTGERSLSASPEHADSASSSPIKAEHDQSAFPRRSASAGAMLWKKKQGAKDWDVEGGQSTEKVQTPAGDEEWDVESAVEKRVVQVMFTVPKEKLRVVNKSDGDGESMLSAEREGSEKLALGEEGTSDVKGKQKEV
ncbi:MAG: hypothetical protein OHK93_006429 [Ramalina farinacea]|uniref:Galactose oxidase n=1 Tax=Ramalina farinacea TaxID=258253 RepID=A0AA43QII5_9LECA|nr:hypothetical protein [Ramalina farinacea]